MADTKTQTAQVQQAPQTAALQVKTFDVPQAVQKAITLNLERGKAEAAAKKK